MKWNLNWNQRDRKWMKYLAQIRGYATTQRTEKRKKGSVPLAELGTAERSKIHCIYNYTINFYYLRIFIARDNWHNVIRKYFAFFPSTFLKKEKKKKRKKKKRKKRKRRRKKKSLLCAPRTIKKKSQVPSNTKTQFHNFTVFTTALKIIHQRDVVTVFSNYTTLNPICNYDSSLSDWKKNGIVPGFTAVRIASLDQGLNHLKAE